MRLSKLHIIRFITLVVALQLLNLSIYAQDFRPLNTSTVSETNITETIVEYVVEVVLGHKNAIPESSQHHTFHKKVAFKAISLFNKIGITDLSIKHRIRNTPLLNNYDFLYLQEINPPPPKAI
ncbi:MAG: hypothetical protein KGO92_10755 [Bacteroidota bacterium]|nr:hypothetical protein [Bacteroidota bacterium]